MATRVLTVIQARTGSTRLPEKVLFPLGPTNVLAHLIDRVRAAKLAGQVVVATTTEREDKTIAELCRTRDVPCFCGHPTDLLDRFYQTLRQYPADVVVKIPANCPLVDPAAIDRVIGHFLRNPASYDYVSNLHPQSYPGGNDVEILSAEALEIAHREAQLLFEREHVTPFLWDQPERFAIGNVRWERETDASRRYRWTLECWEDYLLIRTLFHELSPANPVFGVKEILRFLDARPPLRRMDEQHPGNGWFLNALPQASTVGLPT